MCSTSIRVVFVCIRRVCQRVCVHICEYVCARECVWECVCTRIQVVLCSPATTPFEQPHWHSQHWLLSAHWTVCSMSQIHTHRRARARTHTHTLTRMHAHTHTHTHTLKYKLRHQQKVKFSLIYWSQNRLTPNACDLKRVRSESSAVKIWGEHRRASHHYGLPHAHGNKSKQNSNTQTYSFISKIYLQYACIITVVSSLPIHAVCI